MIDKIAQMEGNWAVVLADDAPAPAQLAAIERDGWIVTQILPHFPGSRNIPEGKVAVYMRRSLS